MNEIIEIQCLRCGFNMLIDCNKGLIIRRE